MKETRPLPLADRLAVEAALETAFAPLRAARTPVSPLRVRAAVRWGRGAPPPPDRRWVAAISRLSELSVAVGMTLVVFVGTFGPSRALAPAVPEPDAEAVAVSYPVPRVTEPLEGERYIRWLRLDRYVPLQDWLDPSVLRVGAAARTPARLDATVPSDSDARGPF